MANPSDDGLLDVCQRRGEWMLIADCASNAAALALADQWQAFIASVRWLAFEFATDGRSLYARFVGSRQRALTAKEKAKAKAKSRSRKSMAQRAYDVLRERGPLTARGIAQALNTGINGVSAALCGTLANHVERAGTEPRPRGQVAVIYKAVVNPAPIKWKRRQTSGLCERGRA